MADNIIQKIKLSSKDLNLIHFLHGQKEKKRIFATDLTAKEKNFNYNYKLKKISNGMITTHFKKLLAVVVCLLTGITAQAQFKGAAEQYPTKDYSAAVVKFSLTEVATALGTDTATLANAYNTWQDAEAWEGENLFWLIGANDAATDQPSADGKGFWMTAEGERITYGEGAVWYAFAVVDSESDAFSFQCGQMPEVMKAGDSAKGKFQLRFNNKSVNFEITLNVIEKPIVQIPDPMLLWNSLTIVDEITKDIDQKPRGGYDADKVEVNLTEALAKLGLDGSLLKDELAQFLYAKKATLEDAALGAQMSDSLTNESSASGIGFWMRNLYTADGDPTFECGRFAYDGDDDFFAEAFAFDTETGILSCNVGQMPNKLKGGNTYYAYIYIVYGDKAIKIRYNLNVAEVKLGTLEDYTEAGKGTIRVEMEPQNNYNTKDFSIDMEEITTALGCEAGDIDDFFMLETATEFAGKNQDGVGYWVDKNGAVIAWGTNAMFYITPKADNLSKLGIGQYPDHMNVGDSVRAYVYFLANSKYYELGIDLVIVAPKQVDGVFESVAQRSLEFQQEVNNNYTWCSPIEIPEAWVKEQIGTNDWVVYGLAALNEDGNEKEGNARYTKQYNCDPNPGFWYDANGRSNGWNSNARFGISTANPSGTITLLQYPNSTQIGDVFKTQLFLVNEDNSKMVTFNITYSIVESVVQIEEVGQETLVVPVDKKGATTTLDLNKIAKALDTTIDELTNGSYLHGMTAEGSYGGGVDVFNGLSFTNNGVATTDGEVFMWFESVDLNDDGTLSIMTMSNETIADDFSAMGQMCFLVGTKRYVIELKFVSKATYTAGIAEAQTSVIKRQPIFDLQGRQVKKTQRGLYIQNGKMILVK